jgi:tRNA-2-methylthio-N6-dimethylallyladenosine synthase
MGRQKMPLKYVIQTYGCQMNTSDSERIVTVLQKMGYEPCEEFKDADLIILNTCSVKQKSEDRIYGFGKQFRELKEKNPKLAIGITGCVIRESSGLRFQCEEEIFRTMETVDCCPKCSVNSIP